MVSDLRASNLAFKKGLTNEALTDQKQQRYRNRNGGAQTGAAKGKRGTSGQGGWPVGGSHKRHQSIRNFLRDGHGYGERKRDSLLAGVRQSIRQAPSRMQRRDRQDR